MTNLRALLKRLSAAASDPADGHSAALGSVHIAARWDIGTSPISPNDRVSGASRFQGEWSPEGPEVKWILRGLQNPPTAQDIKHADAMSAPHLAARHTEVSVEPSPRALSERIESRYEGRRSVERLKRALCGTGLAVSLVFGVFFIGVPSTALAASPPEAPEVTVEAPVSANEAVLHGILNPGKVGPEGTYELGEYQFLYKASESKECKGSSVAPVPPGLSLGGGHEELPAQVLSGLTAGTEYAVCLRMENAKGEATVGPAVSFKTAEATAPVVESQSASEHGGIATLSATIDPGGAATTCEVQYGKTEALEATPVPCPTGLTGDTGQAAAVELTGLQRKTQYYFKFVAGNEKGTTPASAEGTFKTGPNPPSVSSNPASEVKRATAVLNGYVQPYGEEKTINYFEYGQQSCDLVTETCGVKTPVRGPITEEETVEPLKLTRLKPGTTYHFWLVASGPGGTAHGEEETFTTAVAEPEEYLLEKNLQANSPQGVGVNQTTGDVYVSNSVSGTIEQFNAEGVLQSSTKMPEGSGETWQLAVDNSGISGHQGDVYIADVTNSVVYKFDPAGTKDPPDEGQLEPGTPTEIGKGALSGPKGVAVDSSGNIYVASHDTGEVSEFSPAGTVINEHLITGVNAPFGLAVDTGGNIYVAGASGTIEYTSAGTCVNSCVPINTSFDTGVALDSAGDVFVSVFNPASVREYGPIAGHPPIVNPELERAGTFHKFPRDLAINIISHDLYVVEDGGTVKVFRFLASRPTIVKTEPATQVNGPVEALNGTVNPGGQEPAEYYFEYGTSPCSVIAETCGTAIVESSAVPLTGEKAIPVSVRLDNLAPNTTYHYWLVGVNEGSGVEHGEEQTFTTGSGVGPPPAGDESEHKTPPGVDPGSLAPYPDLTGLAPVPGPRETTAVVVHPLTRRQRLTKALRTCRKDKKAKKRKACEALARRHFGPKHTPKKRTTKK